MREGHAGVQRKSGYGTLPFHPGQTSLQAVRILSMANTCTNKHQAKEHVTRSTGRLLSRKQKGRTSMSQLRLAPGRTSDPPPPNVHQVASASHAQVAVARKGSHSRPAGGLWHFIYLLRGEHCVDPTGQPVLSMLHGVLIRSVSTTQQPYDFAAGQPYCCKAIPSQAERLPLAAAEPKRAFEEASYSWRIYPSVRTEICAFANLLTCIMRYACMQAAIYLEHPLCKISAV